MKVQRLELADADRERVAAHLINIINHALCLSQDYDVQDVVEEEFREVKEGRGHDV